MAVNLDRTKRIKPGRVTSSQPAVERKSNLFKPVLIGLVISAVLELLLWRTFSRIGVFIPKKGTFQDVYKILGLDLGVIALNFSVILAVLTFVLAVLKLREAGQFSPQTGGRSAWLLNVALVAVIMVLGITFFELFPKQELPVLSLALRLALLVAFGALSINYWLANQSWQARLFVALLLTAYGMQILAKVFEDKLLPLPAGINPNDIYIPLLLIGEGAVLVNGPVLYLLYGTAGERPVRSMVRNWPAFLGAVGLVGAFVGLTFLTVAESDIVPILGLYSLGYTMQLPLVMYVVALFFALYTIFFNLGHLKQGPTQRAVAFGLILILTGGYQFNISNQYLFALIGVLLLARPELLKDF